MKRRRQADAEVGERLSAWIETAFPPIDRPFSYSDDTRPARSRARKRAWQTRRKRERTDEDAYDDEMNGRVEDEVERRRSDAEGKTVA